MFSERDTKGPSLRKGSIEVVCGSMFSGKTEELIRRMKRAKFAKLRVEIYKPAIDVRYSEEDVVSHDRNVIQSTPVDSSQNILLMVDEVQDCSRPDWELFTILSGVLAGLLTGQGRTGWVSVCGVAGVLVNIALSPIFIDGWGPVPAMGNAGAAIAGVISWARRTATNRSAAPATTKPSPRKTNDNCQMSNDYIP